MSTTAGTQAMIPPSKKPKKQLFWTGFTFSKILLDALVLHKFRPWGVWVVCAESVAAVCFVVWARLHTAFQVFNLILFFLFPGFQHAGCGNRVQKIDGCNHLTCGGSDFGATDWRGRGCGLDFCEVCETPLSEGHCDSSRCRRPAKREKLKQDRQRIQLSHGEFERFYLSRPVRALLRQAARLRWTQISDERAHLLVPATEVLIKAHLARAYAVVFLTFEREALEATSDLAVTALDDWCKALEASMSALKHALVPVLGCSQFGKLDKAVIAAHEHPLEPSTKKKARCHLCEQLSRNPYQCSSCSVFVCDSCVLEGLQLLHTTVPADVYHDTKAVVERFLLPFEQAVVSVAQPNGNDAVGSDASGGLGTQPE
eukprot:m.315432 g.315432  ORF g.315432 m.315432 type:complete len:371 (-) comp19675_c0_seq4:46-1158(-)